MGLQPPKNAKIGNFWHKFSPKGYIPLSDFYRNVISKYRPTICTATFLKCIPQQSKVYPCCFTRTQNSSGDLCLTNWQDEDWSVNDEDVPWCACSGASADPRCTWSLADEVHTYTYITAVSFSVYSEPKIPSFAAQSAYVFVCIGFCEIAAQRIVEFLDIIHISIATGENHFLLVLWIWV